jgi:hypothetical protein
MRPVNGSRQVWPLLAMTALLAAPPALAACGAGGGGAGGPLPYVAEFALGWDTPEERQFALTPNPGPHVEVLPAPSPGPPITPSPLDEQPPFEPSPAPPATSPAPGPAWSFESSVAWVNDGQYLGVVTWGSGSCPTSPHGIEVVADQEIEIRLGALFSDRDACSADISGHVTVVKLPQGVTPTKPLVARFGDREVTIEAVGR